MLLSGIFRNAIPGLRYAVRNRQGENKFTRDTGGFCMSYDQSQPPYGQQPYEQTPPPYGQQQPYGQPPPAHGQADCQGPQPPTQYAPHMAGAYMPPPPQSQPQKKSL